MFVLGVINNLQDSKPNWRNTQWLELGEERRSRFDVLSILINSFIFLVDGFLPLKCALLPHFHKVEQELSRRIELNEIAGCLSPRF